MINPLLLFEQHKQIAAFSLFCSMRTPLRTMWCMCACTFSSRNNEVKVTHFYYPCSCSPRKAASLSSRSNISSCLSGACLECSVTLLWHPWQESATKLKNRTIKQWRLAVLWFDQGTQEKHHQEGSLQSRWFCKKRTRPSCTSRVRKSRLRMWVQHLHIAKEKVWWTYESVLMLWRHCIGVAWAYEEKPSSTCNDLHWWYLLV